MTVWWQPRNIAFIFRVGVFAHRYKCCFKEYKMQIIKQIALCAVCAFIFGACDSNVDSNDSSDSNQNQSNATISQQSPSDESKSALDSSSISIDKVYLGGKSFQIISEQIDFWGKGFFLEWCEGCGEYITNSEHGGVVGIRIFDKSRGEMISDGAEAEGISHQKVLSAEFENGIWTLMLDKDIYGGCADSTIKFRFLRDEFGKIYAQHIYGDKRSVPFYVRDFTYTSIEDLPDDLPKEYSYSGKWVRLESPKADKHDGKTHDCAPLEAYTNATLPKDKLPTQNCFTAYKRIVANFDDRFVDNSFMEFDGYVIDVFYGVEGKISIDMHDADFSIQAPIIFERIKDDVNFILTTGTTLGLYSADTISMRFIDENRQVAYFGDAPEVPFVFVSRLKTLGIPIYSVIYDKDGNEIYNKSEE